MLKTRFLGLLVGVYGITFFIQLIVGFQLVEAVILITGIYLITLTTFLPELNRGYRLSLVKILGLVVILSGLILWLHWQRSVDTVIVNYDFEIIGIFFTTSQLWTLGLIFLGFIIGFYQLHSLKIQSIGVIHHQPVFITVILALPFVFSGWVIFQPFKLFNPQVAILILHILLFLPLYLAINQIHEYFDRIATRQIMNLDERDLLYRKKRN